MIVCASFGRGCLRLRQAQFVAITAQNLSQLIQIQALQSSAEDFIEQLLEVVRFRIDLRHLLISDQKNVPTRLCYKSSSPHSVRNRIEVLSGRGYSIAHT